ncbi:hypothetical protein F5X97DRAFT_248654 [Nemania serpens]|nr:hypothetical protein F5X97DRAFT_248654 [Nemania serpens]
MFWWSRNQGSRKLAGILWRLGLSAGQNTLLFPAADTRSRYWAKWPDMCPPVGSTKTELHFVNSRLGEILVDPGPGVRIRACKGNPRLVLQSVAQNHTAVPGLFEIIIIGVLGKIGRRSLDRRSYGN